MSDVIALFASYRAAFAPCLTSMRSLISFLWHWRREKRHLARSVSHQGFRALPYVIELVACRRAASSQCKTSLWTLRLVARLPRRLQRHLDLRVWELGFLFLSNVPSLVSRMGLAFVRVEEGSAMVQHTCHHRVDVAILRQERASGLSGLRSQVPRACHCANPHIKTVALSQFFFLFLIQNKLRW